MKYFLTILLLTTTLGCARTNNQDFIKSDNDDTWTTTIITLDSLDFNILKFDTITFRYIFPNTYYPTDLSKEEIIKCEKLLNSYIADYNGEAIERFNKITKKYPNQKFDSKDFTIELVDYGRQYIAVTSDNGDKFVFVNCFCDPEKFSYRDKELVDIMDGGNCYFQFKVNLGQSKIFDFMTNGFTP